ncbi:MAG: cell division protein SepF [Phascolarctobacterium sp.]
MKLIDKIMDALSLYDEEDDGLDEELEVKKPLPKEAAPVKAERPSLFRPKNVAPTPKAAPVDLPEPVVPAAKSNQSNQANQAKEKKSFLSFKSSKTEAKPQENGKMASRTINLPVANKIINVIVLEPISFDDSPKIADYLRSNEPVVVNFKGTDNVLAKRMTDFISGTIYALGGTMKKLGRDILICAPKNVDIDAGEEMYDERGEQPWKK